MEKPIAIWGMGKEAAQMYYKLDQEGVFVDRFFDNKVEDIDWFLDKTVYKPTPEATKNYFIYVGCKYRTYRCIADQLEMYGLEEMKDFLWCNLYKKKIVVIHGNCHMEILRQYLLATKGFVMGGYSIYPNKPICENKNGYVNENVLQACSVLIQLDIRDENGYGYKLSSNYLSSKLNKNAKNIRIPNLRPLGYGFFPLQKWIEVDESLRGIIRMFPRTISVIDEMLAEGKTENEIIDKLNDNNLLSRAEIIDNFENYMSKIRAREEKCDVKVSEFILQHYQEKRMFYDTDHPTNYIIEEMWRQICSIMGIEAELDYPINDNMSSYEDPILPCVKNVLGLQYDTNNIRTSGNAIQLMESMDFNAYVKGYIWWKNKTMQGRQLRSNGKGPKNKLP